MADIIKEIQQLFASIDFPIGKEDLLQVAKDKGFSPQIISVLEKFTDKEYKNEDEVKEEASKQSGLGGLGSFI